MSSSRTVISTEETTKSYESEEKEEDVERKNKLKEELKDHDHQAKDPKNVSYSATSADDGKEPLSNGGQRK